MYEPPIHKLLTEIETNLRQQEENAVLQAVVSVGVNVDKEELIKALQYDRGQYEKGYADGCRDSRKQGRWIEDYETFVQDNGYESENHEPLFLCAKMLHLEFGAFKLVNLLVYIAKALLAR